MKRPVIIFGWAMLVCMLFCGCSGILNREFVVTSRHAEAEPGKTEINGERVTEMEEVERLLSEAIAEEKKSLTVRLVYQEDPTGELNEMIAQYRENDPLCAYAVQMISASMTKVLNYYEIHIDIKYQHNREDIASIVTVNSPKMYQNEVRTMAEQFLESRTFLIHNYNEEDYDFAGIYAELHRTEPTVAYAQAQIYEDVVPKNGATRIVEIEVQYTENVETLRTSAGKALAQAEMITSGVLDTVENDAPDQLPQLLHDALCRFAVYDETGISDEVSQIPDNYTASYTAYGALVRFRAVSTGYAMAYKLLCDCAGVECKVIHGRMGGEAHTWNLVQFPDGAWYHIDVSLDDDEFHTGYRFFGLDDTEMAKTHQWEREKYPACDGTSARELLGVDETLLQHSRYENKQGVYPDVTLNPIARVDVEEVPLP